ncbi:hypothetical protein [Chryseobacterium indologenes]|uniref:hypothetical protein n=1 Tax=Chryseobacterium indologenes TaxID=253 RepID=UPI00162844B4|nr:hypothetical protein [Chryseobacterium indologenes]
MNSIKNNPQFNNYLIDLHISHQFEKMIDDLSNTSSLIYNDQHLNCKMLNKRNN